MKRVLIAVLSSRQEPWGTMITTSKNTWDSVHVDGVETIYYVGSPASELNDRVVGFDVEEAYRTMGHKNLLAYDWMLKHCDFDIMVRVNASTYVHKRKLFDHCQGLTPSRLVKGGLATDSVRSNWMWGGYNFLFSRDVVQDMINNKEKWDHNDMEDVAVSYFLKGLGYELDGMITASSIEKKEDGWQLISTIPHGMNFKQFDEIKDSPHFLFRVKQDLKRHIDKHIMQELHRVHTS